MCRIAEIARLSAQLRDRVPSSTRNISRYIEILWANLSYFPGRPTNLPKWGRNHIPTLNHPCRCGNDELACCRYGRSAATAFDSAAPHAAAAAGHATRHLLRPSGPPQRRRHLENPDLRFSRPVLCEYSQSHAEFFADSRPRGRTFVDRAHNLEEIVLEPTNSDNKIAVITVDGVISGKEGGSDEHEPRLVYFRTVEGR